VINEVMSQNEGAWIDEAGEADDWVELANGSTRDISLGDFRLLDGGTQAFQLPARVLPPGQSVLIWVDSDPEQGELHAPFKLSAAGERLALLDRGGLEVDAVDVPALDANQTLARFPSARGRPTLCRYATPGRANPDVCGAEAPPPLVDDVQFASFGRPDPFPPAPSGLALNELELRPDAGSSAFIELVNFGGTPLALDGVSMRVSTHAPNLPWPGSSDGSLVPLPAGASLAPGALLAVSVPAGALSALGSDPAFEGVVTVFDAGGAALDRMDFMRWPVGAGLARNSEQPGTFHFCRNATRGAPNLCDVLPSRDVGDRVRHLLTPGDYAALSAGAEQLGIQSTKFVVDLQAPGLVHLLGSARWPLHYTFIRELVYQEPELDRCDPAQNAEFNRGWSDFSSREYYSTSGRRFLLGTLTHYAGSNLDAVEYTFGDAITGSQMRDGFLAVMPHTDNPHPYVLHAQDATQVTRLRDVEGQVPLVGPNAPFQNVTYQPLTEAVAYGTLRFVPAGELRTQSLGSSVIVITDDVPNDIPLVGGLITEAFQTPLAHVNVLSRNRGTPNAALTRARGALAEYLEQLVRLEVAADGLHVTLADPDEAAAFWAAQIPPGEPVSPRIDTSVRGVQDLQIHGLASLPIVGAKAAQMAELLDVAASQPACLGARPFVVPERPFAIPLVHYREHFTASGAETRLAELEAQPAFTTDSALRSAGLAEVRQLILSQPVDPELLASVEAAVLARFGQARVRFRSSSNTEDLPNFNGAGLYTSISAELGDPERSIPDAMRSVWASLWSERAYDERAHARILEGSLGMGILVHPAELSEHGNGVGVSRNVLEPTRGDQYYINAQLGEASVTNPAPAVSTEQLVYQWYRQPPVLYQSESSLLGALPTPPATVLSAAEVAEVACALQAVHDHFRPLLDPDQQNPWFAMEIEFKLIGPEPRLHVKQARPHSFGTPELIRDCREL
jgi:Pyruvate phosphate dikinase, AMP/ATP-binding domain/Lamin Tail Domain